MYTRCVHCLAESVAQANGIARSLTCGALFTTLKVNAAWSLVGSASGLVGSLTLTDTITVHVPFSVEPKMCGDGQLIATAVPGWIGGPGTWVLSGIGGVPSGPWSRMSKLQLSATLFPRFATRKSVCHG